MGPNVKRLVTAKMTMIAIPPGTESGKAMASGLAFLTSKTRMIEAAQEAQAWAMDAIAAVRQASEPNPWKAASDEEIAGEILRVAEEKNRGHR